MAKTQDNTKSKKQDYGKTMGKEMNNIIERVQALLDAISGELKDWIKLDRGLPKRAFGLIQERPASLKIGFWTRSRPF